MTARGQEVRTLEGPASPGAHEVTWDFRLEPAYEAEEGQGGGGGFGGGGGQGPKVLPGVYQIQIESGETTMLGDLVVRQDPRIEVSREDLAARQTALLSVYSLQGPVYQAGEAIRRLREQLVDVGALLNDAPEAPESLTEEVEAIRDELSAVEDDLANLQVRQVRGAIDGSTTRPTEDQLQSIDRAWEDGPATLERLNALITDRIPALNRRLDDEGIRSDPGEAVEIPRRGGR